MPPAQSAKSIWSAIGKRCHSVNDLKSFWVFLQTWFTYPGDLVVHPCKAKVDPVGDGGAGDEEAARYRDVRPALDILGAHFRLVGRDGT